MLRRKFLIFHGSLIILLTAAAMAAILLLQGVLHDLDEVGTAAVERATKVVAIGSDLVALEAPRLQRHDEVALEGSPVSRLEYRLASASALRVVVLDGGVQEAHDRMMEGADVLRRTTSPAEAEAALAGLRRDLGRFDRLSASAIDEERRRILARFRGVALALGIIFLVVINVSVMVLSRMMTIVMRPIDRLVESSRRLAMEDFSCRLDLNEIEPKSEFGELAGAFNALAAQLESNEQRKLETLHQVSRTLSHEINNAIAIVEMQLALMVRAKGVDVQAGADRLRQIHETLERISQTAAALSRVRRIVLTDYTAGVQMLDLARSTEDAPAGEETPPVTARFHGIADD